MAEETKKTIFLALDILKEYNEEKAQAVVASEQLIDYYEDILGSYMVKLSGKNLSKADSRSLSILLHCSSDLERISDHAANIRNSAVEMREKRQEFSEGAYEELNVLIQAIRDIVSLTENVFRNRNVEGAKNVEPLEEVIDSLNVSLRQRHIKRLRNGNCTIELGIILEDIITDLERVSDHCSNIAVCLIEVSEDGFDTHEYLDINLKQSDWFMTEVNRLKEIYKLPKNLEKIS